MTLGYSTGLRDDRLVAITTRVGNAGLLRIYNGTRPATGGAATTLLGQLTCGSPFAPAPSSQVLTPTTPTQDSAADASGTATWYRVLTSAAVFVMDGDVAAGDMVLNTSTIVAGGPIAVTAWTITAGNP